MESCTNFEELGGIWENHQTLSPKIVNWGGGDSWKSGGKFTKFHARLVCSFEGKVDFKSKILSIMQNHVTSLGVSHPDKGACKVSNTSTPDFSTNLCFGIIHVCRNNGHNKIYDIPMFRHVEISVHICRNISTHLSKYRYVEITVRRNNGTAPFNRGFPSR